VLKEFVSNLSEWSCAKPKITRLETKPVSAKYGFFIFAREAKHNIIHGAMLTRKSHTSQMWPMRQDWQLSKHQIDIGAGKIRQNAVWSSLTIFLRCLDRPEKETVLSARWDSMTKERTVSGQDHAQHLATITRSDKTARFRFTVKCSPSNAPTGMSVAIKREIKTNCYFCKFLFYKWRQAMGAEQFLVSRRDVELRNIMTRNVEVVSGDATLTEAATKMKTFDVGLIPVCDDNQLKGILTDRDIT
jgi:CBS domain